MQEFDDETVLEARSNLPVTTFKQYGNSIGFFKSTQFKMEVEVSKIVD